MNNLESIGEFSPLSFNGDEVKSTYQATPEPLFKEVVRYNYYSGLSGFANYIYDVVKRLIKLLFCFCSSPWPRWSWKVTQIVKDEVISLEDSTASHLKKNPFFTHLLQNAMIPLNIEKNTATVTSLTQNLVSTNCQRTEAMVIRRKYYNDFLCKTSILAATGTNNTNLVSEFKRSHDEMQEIQRGVYIKNHLRREDSLWISYCDRVNYKRKVVREGLRLTDIELVSENSGHPDETLLTFLEETIFRKPKNGCTSVFFNSKSKDLEFRSKIANEDLVKIKEQISDFNLQQKKTSRDSTKGCHAEITQLTSDNRHICEIILSIRQTFLR